MLGHFLSAGPISHEGPMSVDSGFVNHAISFSFGFIVPFSNPRFLLDLGNARDPHGLRSSGFTQLLPFSALPPFNPSRFRVIVQQNLQRMYSKSDARAITGPGSRGRAATLWRSSPQL
ncbi:hypothetical protein ACN47E_009862 [Coniothyrium glycines]